MLNAPHDHGYPRVKAVNISQMTTDRLRLAISVIGLPTIPAAANIWREGFQKVKPFLARAIQKAIERVV